MIFEQIYLGCLAQASYLIGSHGEAAVVDPPRDVDDMLELAASLGLTIRYVLETHLHADFVSGHHELAERTGATIVISDKAGAAFPHLGVKEGDELSIGKVMLRILETPGHTPEGISIVVIDTEVSPEPRAVLTGDTLFVGDVGRPDLSDSRGYTAEQMASLLYDSLHQKLLTLGDAVTVYPAHGSGSLCGRSLSKETYSTLGAEKLTNPALAPMSRDAFVKRATEGLPEVPRYFPMAVAINRAGAPALSGRPAVPVLAPDEVRHQTAEGALILDVRNAEAFGAGHVPQAVNIDLGGQFASWAGALLDPSIPLILVADDDTRIAETVTRLARVGLENVAGCLDLAVWRDSGGPLETLPQISAAALNERLGELLVIDVRRSAEHETGHVPGAVRAPLDRLNLSLDRLGLDPFRETAVICAGGYRSSAACSLLARNGFTRLANVAGGTAAWKAAGLPLVFPVPGNARPID